MQRNFLLLGLAMWFLLDIGDTLRMDPPSPTILLAPTAALPNHGKDWSNLFSEPPQSLEMCGMSRWKRLLAVKFILSST